jgi:ketosteroid isomerase-like protein
MPQDNLEVARRLLETWNSADWAAFKALHTPDVVVIPIEGWPDGVTAHGIDAWCSEAKMLIDSWGEQRAEVAELRAADDHVLVVLRWVTRGRDSQITLDTTISIAAEFKNHKIARMAFFADRTDALEAVGLRD